MAKSKSEKTQPGIEYRDLQVKLSDDDLRDAGDELAGVDTEIAKLHDEIAIIKAKAKEECKQRQAEIDTALKQQKKLREAINTGLDVRPVPCQWHDDNSKPERFLVRNDARTAWPDGTHPDGEVFRRVLDAHEQQQAMFAEGDEAQGAHH